VQIADLQIHSLRTHGLIPEMKIALILADMERTINIKWASCAAVCSWEYMNSGETFCKTLIDAQRSAVAVTSAVDLSRSQIFFFNNNICTLLLVGSRHFLASSVEVYGNRWGLSQGCRCL